MNDHPASRAARGAHQVGSPLPGVAGVTAEVYARLRQLIVSGALAPGAPLLESDLSVRLSVSRTPTRAAILRLQQEGFVVATQVGQVTRTIVSPLTGDDMRELLFIFGALEGLAARQVAQFPAVARLELAATMEAINGELRDASERSHLQVRHAQDLHIRFHRCCVEAAAGRRLRGELDALQPQVERYERVYTGALVLGHEFQAALREHDDLIEMIKRGDPDGAARAVATNWRNDAQRSVPIVAMLGERGIW